MKDQGYHLLYIDDEADLLEIGRLFLEKSGTLIVDTAISADEALEKLSNTRYDAIISDYQMPEMDGIALLAEVRKQYGNIPFILFTGKGREEVVIQAINNGADFYLQKGGDPKAQFAELEHKVRQAIRRANAEHDVTVREQQFAGMAANIPGVVFRFIAGNKGEIMFQYISERSRDILGLDNDPTGFYDRFIAGLDPEHRESLNTAFGEARRKRSPLNFEGWFNKTTGEVIWIVGFASPFEEQEGIVFDGVLFNRTDKKRSEQALRESESTYRSLFTYTEAATIIIEKDTTIVLANDAFIRLYGGTREEIEGKMKWTVFVAPEDRERMVGYHTHRRNYPELPVPNIYEFHFLNKTGGKRRIRLHIGMIQETTRSVASLIDITEILEAQEFIRESEERFRKLSEMTVEGIVIHENGIILDMNPQFAVMFRYAPEELTGRYGFDFLVSEPSKSAILAWINHGGNGSITIGGIRKDKTRFSGEVSTRDIVWKARDCKVVTITDVTERIRAREEILKKRDELAIAYDKLATQEEELRQQYETLSRSERDLGEREAAYRTIFEQSPSPVILTRLNGEYVEVNDRFCTMVGTPREELIGKKPGEIWRIDQNAENTSRSAFDAAGGILDRFETRLILSGNRTISCLISTRVIQYHNEPHILALIEDNTERKRADEELRAAFTRLSASEEDLRANYRKLAENQQKVQASERRFADIINFLPDATFAINTSGEVIAWNQAIEEMTGVPAGSILGKADHEYALSFYGERRPLLIDLIFKEDEEIKKKYPSVQKKGDQFISEIFIQRLYSSKGAYLWFIASPLYDADGKITGAIESIRDVSERRRALDALAESEERFRQLADAAQEAIVIHEDGIIRDLNRRASELFGYTLDQLIGKHIFTLAAPGTGDLIKEQMVTPSELPYEAQGQKSDGTTFWGELRTRNIVFGDRSLRITTLWDITGRKKAEWALVQERIFSDAVMNSVPGMLYLYDDDGNLVRWNKTHETMTGYSADELSRIHVLDWFRWSEHETAIIRTEVEKAIRGGYGFAEAQLQVKSGARIPMYFTAVRVFIDDKLYFVGIGIDISDRKRAETAIRNANKKLNILSSITRHDILNKLTALTGYLDLAREQKMVPLLEKYIHESSDAAEAIRRQIEFTRYYQDIGMQEPQWKVLPSVIRSALAQIQTEGLEISVGCDGISIFADPLIEKVFYNLVENSLRHGETVTKIAFLATQRGSELVILYTDNGTGIHPEHKDHLFQKGFGKNTGLGLFLSREILAITDITIEEHGTPGKGVRFEITVPERGYRIGPDT
ncbi:PAS domain S-box protein [uncultured Methanoregula sp.]|uniref:PAS domain S-box protein n=1 Tax=uncultured Methanoregula sp. TaxID=1005933 RepID=UPI002AABBAF0|nr:PAS domain S-box protein [uncultured Methanoregula sp.]